jgi:hypothetical protein
MKGLRRWERKHIPNLRHNKTYKKIKVAIFMPFILPIYIIKSVFKYLVGLAKIKRKHKPDLILSNIIAGWTNLIIDNPVVEEVAMKRANICAGCPSAEIMGGVSTIIVDNKTTQVRGMKCNECGCPLSAKVRAMNDYCPLGLW